MEQAAITSLNSVKVTVVSGACGCDFQSIQRGWGWGVEVEAVRLVIGSVDILLWLKPRPRVSAFSRELRVNRHLK